MNPSFLTLREVADGSAAALLGYPGTDPDTYLSEMIDMGVDGVAAYGSSSINGTMILGKGHTGVVVLVRCGEREAALKMRRSDSPRPDMDGEAALLKAANGIGVGPRLLKHSPNLVLMEYLRGESLRRWLATMPPAHNVKESIRDILWQCYRLDCLGLDHGELTDMSRHVMVDAKTTIIDFESASISRRPANVTSATQCLYLGGLGEYVRRICGGPPPHKLIDILREYKSRPGLESFDNLLGVLN